MYLLPEKTELFIPNYNKNVKFAKKIFLTLVVMTKTISLVIEICVFLQRNILERASFKVRTQTRK